MTDKKKKIFPKLQKKMKSFLTDESGKITKKDALGVSIGAVLLNTGNDAVAAHHNYTHNSPDLPFPENSETTHPSDHTNSVTNQVVLLDGSTCSHASGIVNGHYSAVPSVNSSYETIDLTTTHQSHGNHGDGGWC